MEGNNMRAYLKNSSIELEIKSFFNVYNEVNVPCLMCDCYVRAYDSIESIPASRIEIK
jgi:hypothetical protein